MVNELTVMKALTRDPVLSSGFGSSVGCRTPTCLFSEGSTLPAFGDSKGASLKQNEFLLRNGCVGKLGVSQPVL